MTKPEFLATLRRRLAGMPPAEIDDVIGDYASHFDHGMAAGRSETEIAEALGDPLRLARELRAEAGLRRWESARTPANFVAVLFAFMALVAVDFVFLLPVVFALALTAFIIGIVLVAFCFVGLVLIARMLSFDAMFVIRGLTGLGLLGIGVGGSALLVMALDGCVRLLGGYARLHYSLLKKA